MYVLILTPIKTCRRRANIDIFGLMHFEGFILMKPMQYSLKKLLILIATRLTVQCSVSNDFVQNISEK